MIILIIILFIIILLLIGIKIKLEYYKKGSEVKGCLKILILKKIKIYTLNFPSQDDDEDDESDDEKKERDIKKIFSLAKPCLNDLLDYLKTALGSIKIKIAEKLKLPKKKIIFIDDNQEFVHREDIANSLKISSFKGDKKDYALPIITANNDKRI